MDFFRSHDDEHQLNIGTVDNPTYEQTIIQSTQFNINYQCADLPDAQYLIPVKIKSNTLTNTCTLQVNDTIGSVNIKSKTITSNSQVNDTSGDVHSIIYQDDVQIDGIYSLANGEQIGKVCTVISKGIEKKTQEMESN